MKRRRMTGSGLNAHMDDQAISVQQRRTVRRCQRSIGQKMDELNEVAKQLAMIWWSYPVQSHEADALGESVKMLDVMLLKGDQVCGWIDDWVLAQEAKEQAKGAQG